MENFVKDKHKSYGTLQISRVHHSEPVPLFGSSIKHGETVRLRINEAEAKRSSNNDWIMGQGPYIEVEMSLTQFSEAITSLNIGSGTPCTVRWIRNEGQIEACPFVDKRATFEDEMKEKVNQVGEELKKTLELTKALFSEKKPLTKAQKDEILNALTATEMNLNANLPFIYKQFNHQMDKTVLEAKGEVEGFIQNKLTDLAMKGLKEEGIGSTSELYKLGE